MSLFTAFGAFPGCVTRCFTLTSRFLPPRPAKVTIYAAWCRHFLSFFLLFECTNNLGICEATKDRSGASSRNREKKEHLEELQTGTDFTLHCDIIGLQMLLWRMQSLYWHTAISCCRLQGRLRRSYLLWWTDSNRLLSVDLQWRENMMSAVKWQETFIGKNMFCHVFVGVWWTTETHRRFTGASDCSCWNGYIRMYY